MIMLLVVPHSELGLYTDGEFDQEGRAFGLVVSHPDIAVMIRDDGIDNGQP